MQDLDFQSKLKAECSMGKKWDKKCPFLISLSGYKGHETNFR